MTELKIAITNDKTVLASYRLDYEVNLALFFPVLKASILKTIASSATDLNSFHYEINQNLDGILITVLEGKRTVSTSLSREESLFLLKKYVENGCKIKVFLITPSNNDHYE